MKKLFEALQNSTDRLKDFLAVQETRQTHKGNFANSITLIKKQIIENETILKEALS